MRNVSRRSFIAGVAGSAGISSLPFSIWADRQAQAQAPASLIRHDVSTSQGQAMLEKYARAVAKMMDKTQIPEGSPTSWLFQFYTHGVPNDRTKEDEIARVYAGAAPTDPHRLLAVDMWNTCMAHGLSGLPQERRMFLPWHRMYVYNFERIIRKVLGDDTFTLPYWDYTNPAKHAIPEQFRLPNDPVFKSLFRADRNDGTRPGTANVNAGEPIDKNDPSNPLNLDALSERDYEQKGVALGFNRRLDGFLHGSIHVLVGNRTNMGSPPWAARDPIFWIHHSNIDRLWESWNAGGRINPTGSWLTQTFTFADENGTRVAPVVSDFVRTETIKVGPYKYDRLEPVPALPPTPASVMLMAAAPSIIASQAQPGPISLSAATPIPVPLTSAAAPMSTQLQAGGQNTRIYLVLQNLQAQAQPEVLYNVYLDPPGAPANPSAAPVGTFNFFDAVVQGHGHGVPSGPPLLFSFDVTDRIAAASTAGTPTVRIAAVGTPAADAKPVVGSVSLVRQ
jgi:tyrosinase